MSHSGYELAYATLAYINALEAHQAKRLTLAEQLGIFETLTIADALSQLILQWEEGWLVLLIAWWRAELGDETALFSRAREQIVPLGYAKLTTGPLLFVAEVLATKPGLAYSEMRRLQRLPGVTHMAAWRNLNRAKVQKVVRDGWNASTGRRRDDAAPARANGRDPGTA